jgi:hypothetical protein
MMQDYLSDGSDGHFCKVVAEIPKYFVYEGKEYKLNIKNLDFIHTQMLEHKLEHNLIGELDEEQNM